MIGKFNDSYNLSGVPLMAASGRRLRDGLVHFFYVASPDGATIRYHC